MLPSHVILQHSLILEILPTIIAFNCLSGSVLISNMPLKWTFVVEHVAFWTRNLICKLFAKLTSHVFKQSFKQSNQTKFHSLWFSLESDKCCECDAYDLLIRGCFSVSCHIFHNRLTHRHRAYFSCVLQCWICGRNCCKLYTQPFLQKKVYSLSRYQFKNMAQAQVL